MPNRILREGILTSERVERLNWAEEVFYRRLMSVVDDYGRYYARPALLLAACYPLLLKKVSDSDIEKWLSACENAALVSVYPAEDGKRYLQLLDFKQQVRAAASKFPPMPIGCVADAQHPPASAHLGVSVSEGVSEGGGETRKRAASPAIEGIPEDLLADYMVVRTAKKAGKLTETAVAGLRREADKAGISLEAAIRACCEYGWQGFNAVWYADRQAKSGGNTTFAQQAADIARTTVPAPAGRDPALVRMEQDAARAKPMSPEIRRALAEAAGRMTQ